MALPQGTSTPESSKARSWLNDRTRQAGSHTLRLDLPEPGLLLSVAAPHIGDKLMAKHHRATAARAPRLVKSKTKKAASKAVPRLRRATPANAAAAAAVAPQQARAAAEVPAPSKKPAYYEAIAAYETGVRALQRHDFSGAAEHFRTVLQQHPDERELVERATLYLRVCERETANRASGPRTPKERIYAATLALNAGDAETALSQLRQALADDPENDHGNYIMAVTLSERGQLTDALSHLRQAIALNPENRSLAKQDPDLAVLRETPAGRELLSSPIPAIRRRPRVRR
jgi:tetratricopeptide (TPR) repeat protein